jgi:tetratricopeptide (TPR) repeat protein
MFTINIYLKLALIAVFILGGIVLTIFEGFIYSWPLILIGLILLASYLLLGTVASAANMVQTLDFAGADKRLGLTLSPKLLYVTNRAFYYIMKGSIKMNTGDNNGAEDEFNKALNLKLPTDNEKAMVLLQLANINGAKNKWSAAKNYFNQAKKLKVTEGQMKEQMDQFEKALKNRGQMNAVRGMGKKGQNMMRPSGKRRRPKMR